MFSPGETAALLAVLGDERSLEGHVSAFTTTFKPDQHFKACCCLLMLLEDAGMRLLDQTQRLVAFYILIELYRGEQPSTNPFMSFLIDAASNEKADKVERAFLQILLQSLNNNSTELSTKSASEFISMFDPAAHELLGVEALKSRYADKLPPEPRMSSFKKASTSNVIQDPDVPPGYDFDSPEEAAAAALIQNSSLDGLEPPWVRPTPPRLPPQEGEMNWLIPDTQHEILWDHGMCAGSSRADSRRAGSSRAPKIAQAPVQQKVVLGELDVDPKLVYHCGLTPRRLPELVEYNPVIAVEAVLKLMNSNQITDYFKMLVISLHSMEVVNCLTTTPTEFVHMYISNCISSCENIKVLAKSCGSIGLRLLAKLDSKQGNQRYVDTICNLADHCHCIVGCLVFLLCPFG